MPRPWIEVREEPTEEAAEAQPDLIFLFDAADLRVLMASPAARTMLGFADIAGMTMPDLAPDVPAAAWQRLVRRMAARGAEMSDFATPLRRAGGKTFATRVQLHRIGNWNRALCCATFEGADAADIRARRRLDTALLHSVIDTAPDAIVIIGRDGRIDGFSPAAERMFGYAADEVIGRNVSILMPEPHRSRHDDYVGRYIQTGEKRIIGIGRAVIALHKSGRTFPIELAVGEVRSGESHVFTGFIRDISARVAAQARASKLQQELNHVARLSAMGEIASMIVHELNQPLTAIANFGEAARRLVDGGGDPIRAAAFMEKSVGQAHRASEMIRRLRSFVSRGPAERETIAVNDVVHDAARLALIGSHDVNIQTRFELAQDLPEIAVDRIQVQQVIVNLIRNGIDAILDAGMTEGSLVVTTGMRVDDVVITVEDSGPGIAPEVAEELFNPFVTTKPGGMGIGLSVSRSIVEAHGGRIWAEPGAAGGTRFHFTLPVTGRRGTSG